MKDYEKTLFVFGYLDCNGEYLGSFWELKIRPKLCWLIGHKPMFEKTWKELKKDIIKYHSGYLEDKFICDGCGKTVKLHLRIKLWFMFRGYFWDYGSTFFGVCMIIGFLVMLFAAIMAAITQ